MRRFVNQTAIITGGGSGIGFAIAEKMAAEGAKVWMLDRDERVAKEASDAIAKNGHQAEYIRVDIINEKELTAAFDRISKNEEISIVVNSAGIVGPNGVKTTEVGLVDFEETCRINLIGSFLVTRCALEVMLPNRYGRILMIASIAGKEGNAGMTAYSASKAGVIGLVKASGKEYAESGVTINALAPATIMTSMVEKMEPRQIKYMTDKIPMKRCGTLDEVANMALWIVSKEASFTTGFTFDLTGGRAVY